MRLLASLESPAVKHPYREDIAESVRVMARSADLDAARRDRMAGALGRLVTEDYEFCEGELGSEVLGFADEFAELPDGSDST
jgi:hypothetical protein